MKNLRVCLFTGLLALSLFAFTGICQDKDWRPLNADDISAKTPVVEADADAEALLWEVKLDDSDMNDLSMKHYIRVKIFTERGREKYSKFDVPFTKGLKIKDLAARVIRPDGSIVEIKKDDIFEREIIKASGLKIKAKSFAVPNIEPGVIVEYRYKEVFEDSGATGRRLEFQQDIPIRRLAYYYKPFDGEEPRYTTFNFRDTKFIKDKDGYYLAAKNNVPSFKEERDMPPADMVKPWIRIGSGRQLLGDLVKSELAKFIKDSAGGDVKKKALEITSGAANDEEKIAKLYAFCQAEISNTTFDPTLTDEMRAKLPKSDKLSDVFKKKQGSAANIDMLFGAMATAAGLDAHVAWIGDRSKMFIDPTNRVDEFLHPGAIAIKVDGEWKFYNPGAKFLPIGQLVWYEEANWAQVISPGKYEWVQTPYTDYAKSLSKRTGKFKLEPDGTLTGAVKVEVQGQPAAEYRMENYDETADKLATMLTDDVKRQITAAEVTGAVVENLNDPAKPLVMRYQVKVPGYAQKTGKRLFVQPGYFVYGSPAVFASDTRNYDMFFRYPWSEKDEIEIEWPAGYVLDNAEAPGRVADPNEIGLDDVNVKVDAKGNFMFYTRNFHFGGGGKIFFPKAVYQPMKGLFDAFNKTDSHTITLKQQ